MSTSKHIAGLMGPVLAAVGVTLLLNQDIAAVLALELAHERAVIVLSGVILLTVGIAVVRAHNVWAGGWPVIVTMLGWLAIIGGLARMWFSDRAVAVANAIAGSGSSMPIVAGLALLALGAFLSFKAYASD